MPSAPIEVFLHTLLPANGVLLPLPQKQTPPAPGSQRFLANRLCVAPPCRGVLSYAPLSLPRLVFLLCPLRPIHSLHPLRQLDDMGALPVRVPPELQWGGGTLSPHSPSLALAFDRDRIALPRRSSLALPFGRSTAVLCCRRMSASFSRTTRRRCCSS